MSERQNREDLWLDPPCALPMKNRSAEIVFSPMSDDDRRWDGDFCWSMRPQKDMESGDQRGEVVMQYVYRRGNNPDDIRSPLKRWKAVLLQGGGVIPLQLEPWAIPFAEQPKARLSKNRRNLEQKRGRIRFRDIGS